MQILSLRNIVILWFFHNFYVGAVLLDSDVLSDHIANVRSKIVSKVLATKSI